MMSRAPIFHPAAAAILALGGPALPTMVWAQPQVTQPLDQAAAKLDGLNGDASDTSTLFGIPTQEQVRKVGESAKSAIQLLDQAERAIRNQLERARVNPPTSAEEKARIKRLRENELGMRLPLLRGRAAALAGVLELDPDQKRIYLAMATGALTSVDGLPTAAEGIRRVTLAAVIVARNQGGRGGDASKRAIEMLRSVLELPVGADPATSISALTRFEAIVALAQCVDTPAEVRRIIERASQDATEPLLRVICIEALARGMKRLGSGTIDPRVTGIDAPVDVLASLATRNDLGLTPEQAELLVFEKLAGAYRDEPRNSDDLVLLARGVVLCRNEGSRSSGLSLLDNVATGAGPSEVRADAAWYAAAFRAQSSNVLEKVRGIESLLTLVQRAPASKRADTAARLAVQRARELGASGTGGQIAASALADALGGAIERFKSGPEVDLYRIELAQSIQVREAADLSRVLDALRPVPANSPHAARAATLMRARVDAHLAEMRQRSTTANTDPRASARALAQSLSLALVVLKELPGARDQTLMDELTTELAEARINAGEKDAEELLKELISSGAGDRIRGGMARLSLDLARSYRAAGRDEAAFNALKAFVEPMDAPDTTAKRPPEYWLAWAEMLELLQKGNTSGLKNGDIRLKIRTLRALDPNLGGEEALARINAVEKALK